MEIHEKRGEFRETIRKRLAELGFEESRGEAKNDKNDHVHFFRNTA
jgi:hypothetical protein